MLQDLARRATIYLFPYYEMYRTRWNATVNEANPVRGKLNRFLHVPVLATPRSRAVTTPNTDTLYSSAWLDLTREPVVVSAPDTDGRYYLLPMLDMWTVVFASPGWRTTGTKAANFLVTPPGWTGAVPADMIRISAPTPYVWIIGRTQTDGPADYDAVHRIQAAYRITLLSEWGQPAVTPKAVVDPSVDMRTPPRVQVEAMSAAKFFAVAAESLKVNPPHITDQPIVAQLKKIGIEPGKGFDLDKSAPEIRSALATVPDEARQLMVWNVPTLARVENGWSMNVDTMGVYGNYYLKRAIVAQFRLGANLPEDAIYPQNLADDSGRSLDGARKYMLHFDKSDLPPVNAFWSVTLYDSEGYQVTNPLNRFALSSWMPFKHNADGSLDLYFQNESPGAYAETNWLPAPKGAFNLTMRLYAPKWEALTRRWKPPAVVHYP